MYSDNRFVMTYNASFDMFSSDFGSCQLTSVVSTPHHHQRQAMSYSPTRSTKGLANSDALDLSLRPTWCSARSKPTFCSLKQRYCCPPQSLTDANHSLCSLRGYSGSILKPPEGPTMEQNRVPLEQNAIFLATSPAAGCGRI
jgi:hypothetical protein